MPEALTPDGKSRVSHPFEPLRKGGIRDFAKVWDTTTKPGFYLAHRVLNAETRRGTREAFPFSVAFLLLTYFFFAAFFAAFFAGFLAAFFVAMVVYSPFSM
jgi:hypothetical protein